MAFYEEFSSYYDRIFPLSEVKLDFLKKTFNSIGAKKILDVGTGTANYALALAGEGFQVTGIDLDRNMIETAGKKSANVETDLRLKTMDMLGVEKEFGAGSFDGVSVIGNVLVHLTDSEDVADFLKQTAGILRSGGILIIQIINYDRILDKSIKGLPKIINKEAGVSLTRDYEYLSNSGLVKFKTRLAVEKNGQIEVYLNSINLNPLRPGELKLFLEKAGFTELEFYGSFDGRKFDRENSIPCIAVAKM